MSRVIKFRAWTGQTMMYQEKQYLGSFIRRVVTRIMLEQGSEKPMEHESYLPKGRKIDDYLQQFTGLLDKNGCEIYDADIVRGYHAILSDAPIYQVYWDEDQWDVKDRIGMGGYDRGFYENGRIAWNELEVIGNVHENPDLLK